MKPISFTYFFTGLIFAVLFASASVAGKFGLRSVDGITLFTIRFFAAGLLLLAYAHIVKRDRLPLGKEWIYVSVFGILGTTLYLGLFVSALKSVAAGITSLAIALNPLLISIFTSVWMKRRVKTREWLSIVLGIIGVIVATYPLLNTVHATVKGLILLTLSMVAYSAGSVYYSSVDWKLSRATINGWQGFIGGLLLLPLSVLLGNDNNQYDLNFWLSLIWLVLPVSVFAVQLWLRLLRDDAVRASIWLFLCPVFGITFAGIFLGEPFVIHTAIGAVIVMTALYLGQFANAEK